MSFAGKSYWLIGASEGLGAELAAKLSAQGAHVILSARSKDKLTDLASRLENATAMPLDVLDVDSVTQAKKSIGQVDGMVYLAGTYDPMKTQDWDTDRVMKMFEINLLGAARVLGTVVPEMVNRNAGHLVLIGSLAAYRGLPGAIGYGASKAGLMSLGETIYCDLRQTDIKVQVINPGFIKTRLTAKNDFDMPQIMDADKAADAVLRLMGTSKFNAAFPAPFKWFFMLGRFMPYKIFARLFKQ